jgi:hypothetical protein
MKKLKEFYQSKRGKSILFFGFYLIFFVLLIFYFQRIQEKSESIKIPNNEHETAKVYTIKDLYNQDFTYEFIINDNGVITKFVGNQETIDYKDFEYQYFLSFININQLMKKSKMVSKNDNDVTYEITNDTLNELLETSRNTGVNVIKEQDREKGVVITLDLSSYMEKQGYVITLNYMVGDNSE